MFSKNSEDIRSAAAGRDDIDTLYRTYIVLVRRQAMRVLGDAAAAEDVAQEVFLRFVTLLRSGRTLDDVAGYLFRMATNAAISVLRRRKVQEAALAPLLDAEDTCDGRQRLLRDVLRRSGPREAEVAGAYYFADMHQEDIAALLGMSRHEVRRRLQDFIARARTAVEVG